MGETLEDLARHARERADRPKLVATQTDDGLAHRSKIHIEDLDFFYGKTRALKQVSIDLPEHQVTGMIGPSGCGKSTLLRVLNRIYSMYPDQRATGAVLLDGEDILGPHVDLRRLRSRIGMVFQDITTFPMSIFENVAFGIRLRQRLSHAEVAIQVEETLVRADLWAEVQNRLHSAASDLSGGQQQRLCIARALSTRPEVIMMDEPTSALDPLSMMRVENLIDDLKRTVTIVLVTHNLQQAARCADQVAFFYLGEMIEAGSAQQMFTAPKCERTQNYLSGRFG